MPALEPVDASFFEAAPAIVRTDVDLPGTPRAVWEIVNDNATWTSWFPGLSEVVAEPRTWTAAGDTRTVVINGRRISERAIIVEPPNEWAFSITHAPLPIGPRAAERVQIEDTSRYGEHRVSLTYTGAFDLNLFGLVIWPVLSSRLVGAWGTAFENLNDLLGYDGDGDG